MARLEEIEDQLCPCPKDKRVLVERVDGSRRWICGLCGEPKEVFGGPHDGESLEIRVAGPGEEERDGEGA